MVNLADIHNLEGEFNLYTDKIKNSKICERNKELVFKFDRENMGLSRARRTNYLKTLYLICLRWFKKPLDRATKDDIIELMSKISSYKTKYGNRELKNYSEWTIQGYKIALKKFYKWLFPQKNSKDYPEQVAWIETTMKNNGHMLPEQLITVDEITKLAKTANHVRDKALILTLYESGCRISELLSLRRKHVQFDKYGSVLIVNGKTGSRRVRLIASSPVLANWLESHPFSEPEAPLWVTKNSCYGRQVKCHKCGNEWITDAKKEIRCCKCRAYSKKHIEIISKGKTARINAMGYNALYPILKRLFEKAGIKKGFNPHLFRHSRATELANKITESQLKEIFGWTQRSSMAATYVHLSGRDVDNALLKLNGLLEEEEDKSGFKGIKCPRCKLINLPKSQICSSCGLALDIKAALAIKEQENQEKLQFAMALLKAMNKIKDGEELTHEESVRIIEDTIFKT